MTTFAPDGDWRDFAACAGMPSRMWFPEPGDSVKEALAICQSCEVRVACLNDALINGERFGIRGGTTARQRQMLRRDRPRRQRQMTHGTPAGYGWHLDHHEKPCWACADANSRWDEVTCQLRREGRT